MSWRQSRQPSPSGVNSNNWQTTLPADTKDSVMMLKLLRKHETPRSGQSTAPSKCSFLLSVSLLWMLSACSTTPSLPLVPRLQANLSQPCPPIPPRPSPLVDPERLIWENQIITQYGDCGLRHLLTVDAWPDVEE